MATGSTPVTTQFTLPAGHSLSDFTSFTVIANGIASASIPLQISPNVMPPVNQNSAEGASKPFNLGSFVDPDGGPWTVDVNWGDGTADSTFVTSTAGPLGSLNHTYAEEGSDSVKVTVTDSTKLSGSATFHVVVTDPAVIPGAVHIQAVEGKDTLFIPVATFTDPGGAEAVSDYSATIDWGDGSTPTIGLISFDSGTSTFTVLGEHTYAEESGPEHTGPNGYSVNVTIRHESAPNAVAQSTATVSDPAVIATGLTINAVEGMDTGTVAEATFIDPGGAEALSDYAATIDWGDGSTPTIGVISFATGVFTVKGDHTYAEESAPEHAGSFPSYAIKVTIDHESAPEAIGNGQAFVSDPSVVGKGGFTINVLECQPVSGLAVATFTDPGGPEALSDYAATIDWGDGHTSAGVVSGPVGGVYTVSGGNTFSEDGTFNVTVTLHHESSPDVFVNDTAVVHDNIGILLLDPTRSVALTATGNAAVTVSDVNNCGAIVIDSNSPSAGVANGNAVVSAGEYDITGVPGTSTAGHGVFLYQDELNTGEPPTADPLAGVTAPTPSASPLGAVHDTGGPMLFLSPGTYKGGISVSGKGSVFLKPGVYYLQGGGFSVSGQGSVSGDGVTIYNASATESDGFSFTGQATVNLSGPTGGTYQSIVFFQDRTSSDTFQVTGNAVLNLSGIVYAAGAQVMVSGKGEILDQGNAARTVSAEVDALDLSVTGNGVVDIDVSNNSPEGLHLGATDVAPAAAFQAPRGMTSPPSVPGAAFVLATTGDTVGSVDHSTPGRIASRAPLTPANTFVALKLVAQSTTQKSTADWDSPST